MNASETELPITGMHCAACALRVERALAAAPGIERAQVNFATARATVRYRPDETTPRALGDIVRAEGFEVVEASGEAEYYELRRRFSVALLLTLPVVTIAMGGHLLHIASDAHWIFWSQLTLTSIVLFWAGRHFLTGAWSAARHWAADMNTLVALGSLSAFFYSVVHPRGMGDLYFEVAASIVTLVLLGSMLQARAVNRSRDALRALMQLAPKTVRVERGGSEFIIESAELQIGDCVIVRPGERVPTDGIVSEGSPTIDESMVTGESLPVAKLPGDAAVGGTLNMNRPFRLTVTKIGADTVLHQIVNLVEKAQGSKAPIQRLADRVAGIFVPLVLATSLLTYLAWLYFGETGEAHSRALLGAVSVLIIACPCALGLATPIAILVGTGRGSERGILIKGGEAFEQAHRITAVVFDKTGTITSGTPTVTEVLPAKGISSDELLALTASVERDSEHPLAAAVLAAAAGLELRRPDSAASTPGRGIAAMLDGQTVAVGTAAWMEERGVSVDRQLGVKLGLQGKTPLYVERDGESLGVVAAADLPKPSAGAAVRRLKELGVQVVMLTGDLQSVAEAVGAQVGIDRVIAEVLPGGKVDAIKALQAEGFTVAMVGDGINDAPALAQADTGIAIGTGTDIAMDASDITLVKGDLNGVMEAIALSKATMRTVRQNLFFAFAYNVIGIPIAAGLFYPLTGWQLSPILASAAMALSSLSVIGNALRLRQWSYQDEA